MNRQEADYVDAEDWRSQAGDESPPLRASSNSGACTTSTSAST